MSGGLWLPANVECTCIEPPPPCASCGHSEEDWPCFSDGECRCVACHGPYMWFEGPRTQRQDFDAMLRSVYARAEAAIFKDLMSSVDKPVSLFEFLNKKDNHE